MHYIQAVFLIFFIRLKLNKKLVFWICFATLCNIISKKGKNMNNKNLTSEKQKELEFSKWNLLFHISCGFVLTMPAGLVLCISTQDPKPKNMIPAAIWSAVLGIFGAYDIYKNAKSHIQLKKKYENQRQ